MCPYGGGWLDGSATPFWGAGTLVCHVLLVETPRDGLVLVDAGIGLEDIRDRSRMGGAFALVARPRFDPAEAARSRVEALGFAAEDVRHIVLTHLDLDHAGGLADFPDAKVHVLRDEHRAAFDPPTVGERHRYRSAQFRHEPDFETYDAAGEPWFGFAAVRELVGLPPELLMIPLSGHSRGHAAVAVEGEGGWLLHCGDAYFHRDEMRGEDWSCPDGLTFFQNLVALDRGAMERNKQRLRELRRAHGDEVRLFSAHDVVELERLQS